MKAMDGLEEQDQSLKVANFQSIKKRWWSSSTIFLFFFLLLLTSAFFYWFDLSSIRTPPFLGTIFTSKGSDRTSLKAPTFPLNCSNYTTAQTCPAKYPTSFNTTTTNSSPPPAACPQYFQWIHEDLRPWKTTGISREMIEKVKDFSHFRLVIINGKAYLEKFKNAFQTRDVFTIWGFLQLLRLYPGKLPDLELMFQCEDMPLVLKKDHPTSPPTVFQYCGRDDAVGIVFPDWSFWGWGELNIRPWKNLLKDIKKSNKKTKWKRRVPYAYWKGNPDVSANRGDLMRCRISDNARLYRQDWGKEIAEGFKNSKLKDQCKYRYKIYIEGRGWSVSQKYILACDSMVLYVKPNYYDFYARSLEPMKHYWPIRPNNKCRDIKFAVHWGNHNSRRAEEIGKAGSRFIAESVKMENVYDYMFHALSEYSKLLKFKPEIPKGAVELCAEEMACSQHGFWKDFMVESLVEQPSAAVPCTMTPSLGFQAVRDFMERKENVSREVEVWEKEFWESSRH